MSNDFNQEKEIQNPNNSQFGSVKPNNIETANSQPFVVNNDVQTDNNFSRQDDQVNGNSQVNENILHDTGMSNQEIDNDKNKNSDRFMLIIGIILVIVIGIIFIVVRSIGGNKPMDDDIDNSNLPPEEIKWKEWEEESETENDITSRGYLFTKLDGYEYLRNGQFLLVSNDSFGISINIVATSFDSLKNNMSGFVNNPSVDKSSMKLGNYSGKEVIYGNDSLDTDDFMYTVIDAGNNHVFEIYVFSLSNGEISDEVLSNTVNIVNNSKYLGTYTEYATEFASDFDIGKVGF